MNSTHQDKLNAVEEVVEAAWDGCASIEEILQAVSMVCSYKSGHIRDNWQDEAGAQYWDRIVEEIDKAAEKVRDIEVNGK